MNQTDKRSELCETGGTVAEFEALPFGSMVRAICSAANHGPDLLYEVMLKATLTIDHAVPTYGLSTWSLMSGMRPRLQWAEGLTNEELEEAEGAVAEAVSPKFDGSVRVGERSTCFLLVAPREELEGAAVYGRYVRPLNETQAKMLGALTDVARLAQSHNELLRTRSDGHLSHVASTPSSTLPGMVFTSRLMSEVARVVEQQFSPALRSKQWGRRFRKNSVNSALPRAS